ncbi:hypothetical protein ABBQ38_005220 [Trebouxia sp. C0009 RCD-2024]
MQSSASLDVAEYEQFMHMRLRTDLNDACSLFQALTHEQEEYRALVQNIQLLVKGEIGNLKTLMPLGKEQGFQVQAEVPVTEFIYVKIGLGFHVQCTLLEASDIAKNKEQQLQAQIDRQTDTISKIRARMILMQESIEAMQAA